MNPKILTLLLFFFVSNLLAQNLPVQTATLFKNNKTLIFKAGQVKTINGIYTTTDIPEALFGTYWVSSPSGHINSVFVTQDSVEKTRDISSIFENIKGKKVRLFLNNSESTSLIEGIVDVRIKTSDNTFALMIISNNKWMIIRENLIHKMEFLDKPDYSIKYKSIQNRVDVNFKEKENTQELGLTYLTTDIGWKPIYRLEMTKKDSGRLALRAELINDQEDLGDTELRLAASIPDFTSASSQSALLNFNVSSTLFGNNQKSIAYSAINNPTAYDKIGKSKEVSGLKLEDYYFYIIRPGNFPLNSRFQYPVFEEEVALEHTYECTLENASPAILRLTGTNLKEDNAVFHYVSFKNKSDYPWTSGTVNILSKPDEKIVSNDPTKKALKDLNQNLSAHDEDLQPVSQSDLNFTPAGEQCKLQIARGLDIKVTHLEASTSRTPATKKVLDKSYDLVKVEAQLAIHNQSSESIWIKINRNIEGQPIQSGYVWEKFQEMASLRINPSYTVSWKFELKPDEKKEWKYEYEIYIGGKDEY